MKRALIICYSNLSQDPRVMRQIISLHSHFEIITAGLGTKPGDLVSTHIELSETRNTGISGRLLRLLLLLFRQYKKYYWQTFRKMAYKEISKLEYDLIIANDSVSWPMAIHLKQNKNVPVIFDAHEYYPLQFEDKFFWNLLYKGFEEYLCSFMKLSDKSWAVCQSIADRYEKEQNCKVSVVLNATKYCEVAPKEPTPDRVRMVHHGNANSSRRIENMVFLMDHLDRRFHLDLILVNKEERYFNYLKRIISERANITLKEPVPMETIPVEINQYDIGLFLLEPKTFNYRNALPNKFFEFIQGRLMIAIGPSPEMSRLLKMYDLGIASESFDIVSLSQELNSLTHSEISQFKKNADRAARELAFENYANLMLKDCVTITADVHSV